MGGDPTFVNALVNGEVAPIADLDRAARLLLSSFFRKVGFHEHREGASLRAAGDRYCESLQKPGES